jgi:hypothetical protein
MANSSIINSVRESNDPAASLNATGAAPPQGVAALPTQAQPGATPPQPTTAPTPAPTAAPTDYTGQLTGLYQSELGRAPDAAGLDYWKSNMTNGETAAQVKSAIDSSSEYQAMHALPQAPAPSAPPAPSMAPPAAPATATYTPATLGTPTAWNVTGNQTMQGQLAGIMDPNSPIIQQARTQGLELANERGLLNSSIGESAALNSAYNAALPIASADAATYSKAAGYNADQSNQFAARNQDATNTAGAFNANQTNQMGQAQLSAQTQAAIAQLQAQTQTNLGYLDSQTKTNLANLDAGTRTNLATIEANYHVLMQSNASASDLFRQITQNVATISMSKDMDGAAKQAAVDNQLQLLKNGMQINGAVSNLNLGSLLNFSDMSGQTAGSASEPGSAITPSGPVGQSIQDAMNQAGHP